jgi:hypothetical protein
MVDAATVRFRGPLTGCHGGSARGDELPDAAADKQPAEETSAVVRRVDGVAPARCAEVGVNASSPLDAWACRGVVGLPPAALPTAP